MLCATIVAVAVLDMLVDRWRTAGFSDDNLLIGRDNFFTATARGSSMGTVD
jgi:hypothetical protein